MKKISPRLKKILIILVLAVFAFFALVVLFLSPIVKHIIEKNDVKWTGREIKIGVPYVNPFTGYVHFTYVRFYVENSDSVMLSVGDVSGTFDLRRLLKGYYEITDLVLDHPVGNIIQNKKDFNFTSFFDAMKPD